MELSVSQQSVGGYPVLQVRGEVDVYSASTLKDSIGGLLGDNAGGPGVAVVDLSEVGFLDSTGLGALVAARSAASENGGKLLVACDRDRILKLFRITGLDSVFDIFPTVDEAVASVGGSTSAG